MRFISAIYPPLFYGYFSAWACVLRLPFARPPLADHFVFGANAENAIERAYVEARGFERLANAQLVAEEGFDFETFTTLGYSLPWDDDPENNPGLPSYAPPSLESKVYPTPDETPVRKWRGWVTEEGEMREVAGAVYAPNCDEDGIWGSVVRCPAIFDSNKKIFGIDAEQALELAEWFLKDLWNHHGIEPKLDQIELAYAARSR